jgi:hypothetical protein
MISEEQKKQVQAEEIYRAEIRNNIESAKKKSIWLFVNSAFGIWVLSTLVVGLLSFGYTQWKENQADGEKRNQALQIIIAEGQFRMAQLDRSMADAFLSMGLVLNEIKNNDGKVSGKLINEFLKKASILSVTIQLGGVTNVPPLGEERSVLIGSSGYSPRHLPFAQGYKYPDHKFLSLLDLAKRAYKLDKNDLMSNDDVNELKDVLDDLFYKEDVSFIEEDVFPLEEVFKDWRRRAQAQGVYKGKYGKAYNVDNIEVDDFKSELMKVSSWMARIKDHLDDNVRYRKEIIIFKPI